MQYPQWNTKEKAIFQAKNIKILHRLQFSLVNNSGLSLDVFSPLLQIIVYGTTVLPQVRRFWNFFQSKVGYKSSYNISIGAMRLRLPDLQSNKNEAKKLQVVELLEGWEDIKKALKYRDLLYISEIIWLELISQYHNNPLVSHFGNDKTQEFIARKYYWPMLCQDVEVYVKDCDICLASKTVWHKPYSNLQVLLVPTHKWKDLFINFMTGLPVLTDYKSKSYNLILIMLIGSQKWWIMNQWRSQSTPRVLQK